ncbi:Coatomer subunit beta', partial [Blyttiomyces sp. JEL0837]
MHDGTLALINHETKSTLLQRRLTTQPPKPDTLETGYPIRTVKYISGHGILVGSDDGYLRVVDDELKIVREFKAHNDYIRAVAVHPGKPLVLSVADDNVVNVWDYSKGWELVKTYKGHKHYIMSIALNPESPDEFATGSLDKTIKVWSLNQDAPLYELLGHTAPINTVSYFTNPTTGTVTLLSGSDDKTIRAWDLATRQCIKTISNAHENNVTTISIVGNNVITAGEDGAFKLWDSDTFDLKYAGDYGVQNRVWSVLSMPRAVDKDDLLVFGTDKGTVVEK